MKQSIYLDTSILIGYFENSDVKRHAHKIINKCKEMSGNPEIKIKIPLIVLGEFMSELTQKEIKDEKSQEIIFRLKQQILLPFGREIPAPSRETYNVALELMNRDHHLKPTDALIVAQALVDEESEWLITTDGSLLDNRAILEIIEEKGSKLKISDRFRI